MKLVEKMVVFGASVAVAGIGFFPAVADAYTANVNVGTGFTRMPDELFCFEGGGCTSKWDHTLATNCDKIASARIRFQRDLLPDETVRSHYDYTGCDTWGWTFTQENGHAHHYDGKVTSGSATMNFTVK